MRKVTFEVNLYIPVEVLWNIVLDIENYPTYFKYISNTQVSLPIKEKSEWSDTTTILWFPMRILHKVIKLEKNKEIAFDFPLSLGGKVTQSLRIQGGGKMTRIEGEVLISFENKILDFFVGPILEKRFEDMLETAVSRFKEKHDPIRRKKSS